MTEPRRPKVVAALATLPVAVNYAILRTRLHRFRDSGRGAARRRFMVVVGAGGLVALALTALSMLALDNGSLDWGRNVPPAIREYFSWAMGYGKSAWLLIPSGIFAVLLLCGDWNRVERRIAAAWTEIGALVFFFFCAIAGAGLTTDVIKFLVGRSRPWRFADNGHLTFAPFSFESAYYSFPSGHATTAAAAAVALVLMLGRWRWLALVVLGGAVASVAVGRVMVHAHFPSDTLGGIFVGAAFTYGLAVHVGRTGVAFQRCRDGSLSPKTVAVRQLFRQKPSIGALNHGLIAAFSPGQRPTACRHAASGSSPADHTAQPN